MDEQLTRRSSNERHLEFTRNDFDDFIIALTAKLRLNETADKILSGELRHPLVDFQQRNSASLQGLNVPYYSPATLLQDPAETYVTFLRQLTQALLNAPAPVPDVGDLNVLQEAANLFRRGERFIYSTIVATLKVGDSMHYARQCKFGAGQMLLQTIINDNRQVTTRSLMAVFSALLGLSLRDEETFEQFSRRIDLLIQRLRNWRPPVVLPEQLLLFCALRALPAVPYGPVRHIILASPRVTYQEGMAMLRDVANTGGELITNTLGSGSSTTKPAAVLCTAPCEDDAPASRSNRHQRQRSGGQNRSSKKPLYMTEGPCVHHGPNSRHATSECRDPGLTKRKKKKATASPQKPSSAFTASAAPSPSTDVMYSSVFVTTISKAATKFPRAKFSPARNVRPHFQRSRKSLRSPRYSANAISHELCDSCIAAYTRPIPGSFSPAPDLPFSVPRSSSRYSRRSGRSRRSRRRRANRRLNYPAGLFVPAHPRPTRKFERYNPLAARDRRRRRRSLSHRLRHEPSLPVDRKPLLPSRSARANGSCPVPRSASATKNGGCPVRLPVNGSCPASRSASAANGGCPADVFVNGSCPAPRSSSVANGGCPTNDVKNGSCPAPCLTSRAQFGGYPIASPELSRGTVFVLTPGFSYKAYLFFALHAEESCVTTAALPPNLKFAPRAPPPNVPVFLRGLTPRDLQLVGATHCTFSRYTVADLEIAVTTEDSSTFISAVPLRVIQSDCPCVLLGSNDVADWRATSSSRFPPDDASSSPSNGSSGPVPSKPPPSSGSSRGSSSRSARVSQHPACSSESSSPTAHTDPLPSSSSTSTSDIEAAAWCALTASPTAGESAEEAHLRVGASFAAHAFLEDSRAQQLLASPLAPCTDSVFVLVGSVRDGDRPQGVPQSPSSSSTDDGVPLTQPPARPIPASQPDASAPAVSVVVPDLPPSLPTSSDSAGASASSVPYVPAPVPGLSRAATMRPERSHWPYYGVARGISPFVYETWEECKASTHGVPGALYKGFLRYEDAASFVQANFKMLKRRPNAKRVRRFKGFGWSMKGTKASRSRARYSDSSRVTRPAPETVPPPPVVSTASSTSLSTLPRLRTARAVYCWAEGLSTTLEFPQQFLVSLSGERPLPSPAHVPADDVSSAASALSSVISAVRHLSDDPFSLCNHPGCVFNKGSYSEKRQRLLRQLRLLDQQHQPTSSSTALVTAYTPPGRRHS